MDGGHRVFQAVLHLQADPVSRHEMLLPRAGEKVGPGLPRDKVEPRGLLGKDALQGEDEGTPDRASSSRNLTGISDPA